MPDPTVADLLKTYLAERNITRETQRKLFSAQIGFEPSYFDKILSKDNRRPNRGTLLRISDGLRLGEAERGALEQAAAHPARHDGYLKATKAEACKEESISMRRAFLLLTGPEDPSKFPYAPIRRGTRWERVVARSGVVFGPYDVVARVTTPLGVSVLDYSQFLFQKYDALRTIETIPLRDDMRFYVDKSFSNEHLGESDYIWATIFVQTLGGRRSIEFPDIFFEASEKEEFWGGVHMLTAGITVGQFDSVVEILAANLGVLQRYVRKAQAYAWETYGREAHTITYFARQLAPRKLIAEF